MKIHNITQGLRESFVNWVAGNQKNYVLLGIVTFGFPLRFMRWIFETGDGGKPWGNKSCFTLSFDCDYPEDIEAIPSVLKVLKGYPFKVSFACVGYWIEKYPEIHKEILGAGHEIVNHTYSHPDNELLNPGRKFKDIPKNEKREEVEKCHEICWKILRYEPKGCRIPHFKNLFTREIYSILEELNYVYSSSTWSTMGKPWGSPFLASNGIVEFPLSTCPKHPFTVFDTWHALNSPRWSHRIVHRSGPEDYERMFRHLLRLGKYYSSYLNVYIDPLDVSKIARFPLLLDMLVDIEVEVLTYSQFLEKYPVVAPGKTRDQK